MFNKGDRVKLNEYGLSCLSSNANWRDLAAGKVFVVLGQSRDKRFIKVIAEGSTSKTVLEYTATYLEAAEGGNLRKGRVVTIYEDPLTETKPEGKAQLISPIDQLVPVAPDGMERWWVQFLDDDFHNPVARLIKVQGAE